RLPRRGARALRSRQTAFQNVTEMTKRDGDFAKGLLRAIREGLTFRRGDDGLPQAVCIDGIEPRKANDVERRETTNRLHRIAPFRTPLPRAPRETKCSCDGAESASEKQALKRSSRIAEAPCIELRRRVGYELPR